MRARPGFFLQQNQCNAMLDHPVRTKMAQQSIGRKGTSVSLGREGATSGPVGLSATESLLNFLQIKRQYAVTYQVTIPTHSSPLFTEPALRCFTSSLQNDRVALQTRRHVVPRGRDELVFAAQVLDFQLELNLGYIRECYEEHRRSIERGKKIRTEPFSAVSFCACSSCSRKVAVAAICSCKSCIMISN